MIGNPLHYLFLPIAQIPFSHIYILLQLHAHTFVFGTGQGNVLLLDVAVFLTELIFQVGGLLLKAVDVGLDVDVQTE